MLDLALLPDEYHLDLHGTIPCYSPCMEEVEQTMLGCFELRGIMIRKTDLWSHCM